MRVTANTFSDALVTQLGNLASRQQRLQSQAATGQRVRLPEDDPVALRQILDLQTEFSSVGQYSRNIARQQELAQASYASIKAIKTTSDRARTIATSVDDLKSAQELKAYATEVTEMIKQAVNAMNSTNRGDSLFGGTRTDVPPYVVVTDSSGNVTSVTYQGNTNLPETEIAEGVTITSQVVGENTSGSGPRGLITDSRGGADFFNHLIALQNHLLAGDAAAINTIQNVDRTSLAADEDNILYHVSGNGAIQSRLETSLSLMQNRGQNLEGQVSNEADADLAQTLVKLGQVQTAYQAALQSGAQAMKLSLMDYLR